MKCIFCKADSTDSVSIEHVIPESLGNKDTVLPRGAVCDKCNNYFAVKIEKEVLSSGEFTAARYHQSIESKKGRLPEMKILIDGIPVASRHHGNFEFSLSPDDYDKVEMKLSHSNHGVMYIPISGAPPKNHIMSRFLAKMALEALAHRWCDQKGWNEYLVSHKQLDAIRNFARFPKRDEEWLFSKRRICGENEPQKAEDGNYYQILNEWDILVTGGIDDSEFYFVIAIFGVEYAINLAGNSIDGYLKWLRNNGQKSPLYIDKRNA